MSRRHVVRLHALRGCPKDPCRTASSSYVSRLMMMIIIAVVVMSTLSSISALQGGRGCEEERSAEEQDVS